MYSFKDEARNHGNYLAFEGDLGEFVWLLSSGEIHVFKYICGRSFLLGVISEKSVIGEELLFEDSDDSASGY
jgi:CRP-like cAMP-binding protein